MRENMMEGRKIKLKELKTCPFCGQDAATVLSEETDFIGSRIFAVMCENCCCGTGHYRSRNLAVESWNRRPETNKISLGDGDVE